MELKKASRASEFHVLYVNYFRGLMMYFIDASVRQNGWGIAQSAGGLRKVAEPQSLPASRSAVWQIEQFLC